MSTGTRKGLRWAAVTDTGRVRSANEDNFAANERLFAVADGMGGHLAGEVASEMAVSALLDALGPNRPNRQPVDTELVVSAVQRANREILYSSRTSPDKHGMGTTLTAIAVVDTAPEPRLALVNVGDSRCYVMRRGRLQQLSVDHSYVQELIETGQLTKADARYHPQRNIVTRALGIEPNIRVDAWTLQIVQGDRFLLCSDGLVDEVLDETIGELLDRIEDPYEAAIELVATANRHGGRDNITVLILDVLDGSTPIDPTLDVELDPHWADGEAEIGTWNDDPTPESPWAQPAASAVDDTPSHPGPINELDQRDITRTMALPKIPRRGASVDDRPSADPQRMVRPGLPVGDDGTASAVVGRVAPHVAGEQGHDLRGHGDHGHDDDHGGHHDHDHDHDNCDGHDHPRFLMTWRTLGFLVALTAVAVAVVVALASSARSGYFVGFADDQVAIYKGRQGGVLWFDPTLSEATTTARSDLTAAQAAEIETHPDFDALAKARVYVANLTGPAVSTDADAAATATATANRSTTTPPVVDDVTTTTSGPNSAIAPAAVVTQPAATADPTNPSATTSP